ncbi:Coenzyme PQQ biosynthesis protein A [Erwinia sp. Ejp617]|nr:Coenzyme PQQ biosynthesis protein A [Erwinia sp. Ejp617]
MQHLSRYVTNIGNVAILVNIENLIFFTPEELIMQWTKPTFIDMRLGLEVTLYISNR